MAYNTVIEIQNDSRRRKSLRQEKRKKFEAKRAILLKNKLDGLPGSNLVGYGLNESDEVKRLW